MKEVRRAILDSGRRRIGLIPIVFILCAVGTAIILPLGLTSDSPETGLWSLVWLGMLGLGVPVAAGAWFVAWAVRHSNRAVEAAEEEEPSSEG